MLLHLYVKAKTLLWGARDKITNEDGAVATEYGLLLVLIAIAIVAAATALGVAISGVFTRGKDSLSGAGS
ncbi:MAG: Flp family type IVb pilin [Actinomycetota bacterium]|jgi:Flp pilus assembly pilin Flp